MAERWRRDDDAVRDAVALVECAGHGDRKGAAAVIANMDGKQVAILLGSLREAGADEQAAALTCRRPAAGMVELFLKQEGPADRFRFGREADGTAAAPWRWEDLDLTYGMCPTAGIGGTGAGNARPVPESRTQSGSHSVDHAL
jgi:hypothetical protein